MVLLPDELLAEIDRYRRSSPDLPARTEAIRRLIRIGLRVHAASSAARSGLGDHLANRADPVLSVTVSRES